MLASERKDLMVSCSGGRERGEICGSGSKRVPSAVILESNYTGGDSRIVHRINVFTLFFAGDKADS